MTNMEKGFETPSRNPSEPGIMIEEDFRAHLVAAPPELVKILPEPESEVRYYVAGSNVVAVDKDFRVVDSLRIPSITFTVDD